MRLFKLAHRDMPAALPFRHHPACILGRCEPAKARVDPRYEIIMVDRARCRDQHLAGPVVPPHEGAQVIA